MAQLESDLLRTFVTIAETRNFTKAAENLFRTQSAISMQMKRLETMVGEALFERGSRGVMLTPRGHELLPSAKRVILLLDETAASLNAAPLHGHVRIGIPEGYNYAVLSRALGVFARQHRNVEVTVRYGHSARNKSKVAAGELDLAVVFEWENFSDGEVLANDPTVWVTSNVHQTHHDRPIPVALYERSDWSLDFAKFSLDRGKADYRVVYRSDTTEGLVLAARAGLAIAPLSRSNIPVDCRELTVADGFEVVDRSNVVLLRHQAAASAAVEGMAAAVREAFSAGSVAAPTFTN